MTDDPEGRSMFLKFLEDFYWMCTPIGWECMLVASVAVALTEYRNFLGLVFKNWHLFF